MLLLRIVLYVGEEMKIIQIMPEFGLGGAEIMCENLTYGLKKSGHTVIVVSLFDYHSPITKRMEQNNIDIRYMNKRSGLDLSMIFRLIKLFSKEKPDVIHTHRHVLQYAEHAYEYVSHPACSAIRSSCGCFGWN